jgi:hypothetical protein
MNCIPKTLFDRFYVRVKREPFINQLVTSIKIVLSFLHNSNYLVYFNVFFLIKTI